MASRLSTGAEGSARPWVGAASALPGGGSGAARRCRRVVVILAVACLGNVVSAETSNEPPLDRFIVRAIPSVTGGSTETLGDDRISFTYLSMRVDDKELQQAADFWCAQFEGSPRLVSDTAVGNSFLQFERRQSIFDCAARN